MNRPTAPSSTSWQPIAAGGAGVDAGAGALRQRSHGTRAHIRMRASTVQQCRTLIQTGTPSATRLGARCGPPQKVNSTHDAEGSGACAHRNCNRNKRRIARKAQSSRDHQAAPPPPASTRPRRSAAAAEKKCQCSCTVTRPKPCVCDGKRQRRLQNSSGGTKRNCIYLQGRGAAGGGARHCGAPMLRRYATTSASLLSMAHLSAVLPALQGR